MEMGKRVFVKLPGLSLIVLCLLCARGTAAPLNLTLTNAPDIFSGFIDVTYNATSDQFVAQGFSLKFYSGTATNDINNGGFSVNATIDAAGNFSVGSLTVSGSISNTPYSGVLLTGSLAAFGYRNTGGDPFEFNFNVTGGSLAPLYGSQAGLILKAQSTFNGSFAANFDNLIAGIPGTGSAVSDAAPVIPEPSPRLLVILAAVVFGAGQFMKRRIGLRRCAVKVARY